MSVKARNIVFEGAGINGNQIVLKNIEIVNDIVQVK